MPISLNTLGAALRNQIRETVLGGDAKVPANSRAFLSWLQPACVFSPEDFEFAEKGLNSAKTAEDVNRLNNQAWNFAMLFDFRPSATQAYERGTQEEILLHGEQIRLSDVYDQILRMSKVTKVNLSEAVEKKLAAARAELITMQTYTDFSTDQEVELPVPSDMKKKYDFYAQKYDAAVMAYNAKRNAAETATGTEGLAAAKDFEKNGQIYLNGVQRALDAWEANGFRNRVDSINAYINQTTQRSMLLWKRQMQQLFAAAQLTNVATGLPFHFTTAIPGGFAKAPGWTTLKITHNTCERLSETSGTDWSAGANINWGVVHIGGGAQGSETVTEGSLELDDFSLSYEITQVIIARPWLSMAFLTSKGWTLEPGSGGWGMDMPSDGARPPHGSLVGYPTSALFVRNVKIRSKKFADAYRDATSTIGGGGAIGCGIFMLGGSATHSTSRNSYTSKLQDEELTMPGIQCIAVVNHLFDKMPQPDPQLKSEDFE
ncbi:hypothetical protein GCM10020367_69800 [Streptomyces sannanensis]|uniref:Uncharacterized protein n=1 Tax=Streptomyces sannanensis TaxID=285536 RepID=A0ABP6SMY3_9ACTN